MRFFRLWECFLDVDLSIKNPQFLVGREYG
jgi:hypothetical protein